MVERRLEVPGGQVHLEDAGAGEPVLLLHAGVTDCRIWDLTIPALVAAGFRPVRYDDRGYGRSPRSESPYSRVGDALAVLDAAGLASAHFVGLSQGAATSVDVALATPHRVRSLTLVAPGLSGHEWPRLPEFAEMAAAAAQGDAEALAYAVARLWAPLSFEAPDGQPAAGGDHASRIVTDQAAAMIDDSRAEPEPDARGRLVEIAAATLVVLGDRDLPEITRIGSILAAGIPDARLVTLEGADHLLPLRVPERLHRELVAHLAAHS